MSEKNIEKIAGELGLLPRQVEATASLLKDGATVPFIARYRKEVTGSLDEVVITGIRDRLRQLADLDTRRESILKSLAESNNLTDELGKKIEAAATMAILEDLYLPFKPKRRTRAIVAREKGLEPLAKMLFEQGHMDTHLEAATFVDHEKGVETQEDALAGARDIIAEWVNEDHEARMRMRALFAKKGVFRSNVIPGMEKEGNKYRDYFDWEEPVASAPSHRTLAMRRGEKEGVLTLNVLPPEGEALSLLESLFVKGESEASSEVKKAVHDSYKRLLSHAMETEIRAETKKRADNEAIRIFADNIRELLLAAPLGQKNVLAIDPGFRTGCKVVCLDRQGKLLDMDTVYPLTSDKRRSEAAEKIEALCERYHVEAIAIGNGTGGRETERFTRDLRLRQDIEIVVVNESGASIYSASEAAREEFPDQDVTVRGSVSIGRRLMDPLAELVKIEPKSIGVGQYQHDVDQGALKGRLDEVVTSCVNAVGVEVNTASKELLTYVSGLGPQLARNIVVYRDEHGPFLSRESLKNVSRLGKKAFEQAAGFLRILGRENPLDASAVHPESYPVVDAMVRDLGCKVSDLMEDENLRKGIDIERYITDRVGLPTLNDILDELARPGRDPRKEFEAYAFAEDVEKMEDLEPGMKLPGVVTNVTAFGAFVDIGVHQDGLVHVSQLSDHFVKDPGQVVKVHDRIKVTVLDVDLERKRISLSMKSNPDMTGSRSVQETKNAPTKKTRGNSKKKDTGKKRDTEFFNNPFADAFKRS